MEVRHKMYQSASARFITLSLNIEMILIVELCVPCNLKFLIPIK